MYVTCAYSNKLINKPNLYENEKFDKTAHAAAYAFSKLGHDYWIVQKG